jgi:hypothetical protein
MSVLDECYAIAYRGTQPSAEADLSGAPLPSSPSSLLGGAAGSARMLPPPPSPAHSSDSAALPFEARTASNRAQLSPIGRGAKQTHTVRHWFAEHPDFWAKVEAEVERQGGRLIPGVVKALSEALEAEETLVAGVAGGQAGELDVGLARRKIGDEGACALGAALRALPHPLPYRRVDLYGNELTFKGMEALREPISLGFEYGELAQINLSMNALGDRGIVALAEALPGSLSTPCESLTELTLSSTCCGDEGVEALGNALPRLPSLMTLGLSGNAIGCSGAASLAAVLPGSMKLEGLYLSHNRIKNRGALALADALPHCLPLRLLYIRANKISDAGRKALLQAPQPLLEQVGQPALTQPPRPV